MKKLFTLIIATAGIFFSASAQFEYVSGTIKHGTQANSVILALTSNTTFTGNFSNIQFTIQVPNTVSPQPTVTVIANPLSTYWSSILVGSAPDAVVNEGGYYNYTFSKVFVGSPAYTFTAGVELNTLEIQLTNGVAGASTEVRFGHLANGGTSAASAFYVEMGGSDYTNYTNMFYGPGNSNGGMYDTYNYVPLAGVSLPLTLTSFNVVRKGADALLNWSVDNQTAVNSYFIIERSLNGVDFTSIANLPVIFNGNSKADYNYTDRNFATLKTAGSVYYRIKQVDIDGKYVYTSIRNLTLSNTKTMSVQPNPIVNLTTLEFESVTAAPVKIMLTDLNGRVLQTRNYQSIKGNNLVQLNLGKYAKGNYNLTIVDAQGVQTMKVIKL